MRIRNRSGRVSSLAIVGVTLAALIAARLIRFMTGPSRIYIMADPSVAADTGLRVSVFLEERGVSRSVWTSAAHTDSVGPIAASGRGHLVVRISASGGVRHVAVLP